MRFAYFDVGGTLLAPWPSVGAVYAKAGAPFGLEAAPELLERAFREAWPRHLELRGPLRFSIDDHSTRDWWRKIVFEVLEQVGFEADREAVFDACYRAFAEPSAWRIFDDVLPTFAGLEALGIPIGVISNWDLRLPPLLDALGLSRRLRSVVISCVEGIEKPDPRIFELACVRAEADPKDILYVGDHLQLDVLPARELGMQAYLLDRWGEADPEDPTVLARLDQLLERI